MRGFTIAFGLAALALGAICAEAQQAQPPQQPQQSAWDSLPRMQLERQFAGPLRDTVIQRWRDLADGTICYIYLPISAQHSPPLPTGFVNYGSNGIGSISCVAGAPPKPPTPNPKGK